MSGPHAPIGEDDLQAFIDDRLGAERRGVVESYLAEYPDVAERVATDRRLRDSLRADLQAKFAEPIPLRLRIASIRAAQRARRAGVLRRAAAAAVIFLVGGGAGWIGGRAHEAPGARLAFGGGGVAPVAEDAVSAYRTFVVEVAHPVEVRAANEAHLLQWLSKRLGRRLVAPDLSEFGYRLMGGRLLPGGGGAAAQLMYDDPSGRRLTVYVQAATGTETAFRFRQEGEASTFAWIDHGFGFAVTTTAGREELLPVAEAVYRSFDGGSEAGPAQKG
ncbi:putative transmembrane anti-sigma factor [Methylocella silvestris BL2]|uniref:Putative transmembrane anti-sigma factor n=1 Tax=Methylocella silvestris (strain DSM 15510 / CIP 108128 / LMG 27833 / NCIMB 13906 / BL2) TaxID=395965 RepID=B8ESD3_METSB|nr:anti-sigma factor [Methylocella silvestris]ACK49823.1 putative transmembrane anti-sigma factor [Methylocella silvestris BL2]